MKIRSDEEILERMKNCTDLFSSIFEVGIYLFELPYELAQPFLKERVTEQEWTEARRPGYEMRLDDDAKDYLEFFKEKIEDKRGLSVLRAVIKYRAWKWLLGHTDADNFPTGGNYQSRTYDYLKEQIESGDWDLRTEYALVSRGLMEPTPVL